MKRLFGVNFIQTFAESLLRLHGADSGNRTRVVFLGKEVHGLSVMSASNLCLRLLFQNRRDPLAFFGPHREDLHVLEDRPVDMLHVVSVCFNCQESAVLAAEDTFIQRLIIVPINRQVEPFFGPFLNVLVTIVLCIPLRFHNAHGRG